MKIGCRWVTNSRREWRVSFEKKKSGKSSKSSSAVHFHKVQRTDNWRHFKSCLMKIGQFDFVLRTALSFERSVRRCYQMKLITHLRSCFYIGQRRKVREEQTAGWIMKRHIPRISLTKNTWKTWGPYVILRAAIDLLADRSRSTQDRRPWKFRQRPWPESALRGNLSAPDGTSLAIEWNDIYSSTQKRYIKPGTDYNFQLMRV